VSELSQAALSLLARREHSSYELSQKLVQKGFAREEVAELLIKLAHQQLQSEQRYCHSVIRNRVNKGYGWRYIEQQLKANRVDSDIYLSALEELAVDWLAVARLAYEKKFSQRKIKDTKDKAKRIRFLQSRGFGFDEIMALIPTD
jgi:regulatory protein